MLCPRFDIEKCLLCSCNNICVKHTIITFWLDEIVKETSHPEHRKELSAPFSFLEKKEVKTIIIRQVGGQIFYLFILPDKIFVAKNYFCLISQIK